MRDDLHAYDKPEEFRRTGSPFTDYATSVKVRNTRERLEFLSEVLEAWEARADEWDPKRLQVLRDEVERLQAKLVELRGL